MRIICAVDGSEYAQWGVQALKALANREPEQVVLLHVVDPSLLQATKGKNPVAVRIPLLSSSSFRSARTSATNNPMPPK